MDPATTWRAARGLTRRVYITASTQRLLKLLSRRWGLPPHSALLRALLLGLTAHEVADLQQTDQDLVCAMIPIPQQPDEEEALENEEETS